MGYESTLIDSEYLNFILITLKPQRTSTETKRYADALKDLVCVGENVDENIPRVAVRDHLIDDIQSNIRAVNLSTNTLEYLNSPILEYRFVTQVPLKPIEEWIHNYNCNLSLPKQNDGTYGTPNDLIEEIKTQMRGSSIATKQHDDDDEARW